MLKFERLNIPLKEWQKVLSAFGEWTIFQTQEWLAFLAATQKAEPILAVLRDGDVAVGNFAGMRFRRFGLPILGSPFAGWTTGYMGFNISEAVSRRDAFEAFERFVFRDLGCIHFEIMDRNTSLQDMEGLRFEARMLQGFEVDLTATDERLLANMTHGCRGCIRKAQKHLLVEEAQGIDFAIDYYAQLTDVFAKQQLVPSYGIDRVHQLIHNVQPSNGLLLLRAREPGGKCIASVISLGANRKSYLWGSVSLRSHQILRPNELLIWTAMQYWKSRGMQSFDMGGAGEYKRKYGGREIAVPWFHKSTIQPISALRSTAHRAYSIKQRFLGKWSQGSLPKSLSGEKRSARSS